MAVSTNQAKVQFEHFLLTVIDEVKAASNEEKRQCVVTREDVKEVLG